MFVLLSILQTTHHTEEALAKVVFILNLMCHGGTLEQLKANYKLRPTLIWNWNRNQIADQNEMTEANEKRNQLTHW